MPKLKVVTHHIENSKLDSDHTFFKSLYENYAPKVFGFITNHTATKAEAEELMMNVFMKIWEDIKANDHEAERKIQRIVLIFCRPLFKRSA